MNIALNLAGAYFYRALAYQSQGNSDKALSDLTEAIRLDPKMAEAYMVRSSIEEGDEDQAKKDYDEAVRMDPNAKK